MEALSPTARVILGVLGLGPRSGYDIKKLTDYSTRFFWGASYGQIYPELRRLEAAGLVEAEAPSGARRRRAYRLTEGGRSALHGWLTGQGPASFEYRDEGLLKLFFGDLVEPEEILEHVRRMRGQFEEILAHFRGLAAELAVERERDTARFPYLALDYGVEFMQWVVGWWAALEEELRRAPPQAPPP
jgi:PadR family transcriptional regulator, regulatory protein AphA